MPLSGEMHSIARAIVHWRCLQALLHPTVLAIRSGVSDGIVAGLVAGLVRHSSRVSDIIKAGLVTA